MRYSALLLLAGLLLLPSCVMDNGNQMRSLQNQLDVESQRVQELTRRVELLSQNVNSNRQPQANLANEINALRQEVARLNGRVEETQNPNRAGASAVADNEQIRGMEQRLGYIESYLGIAKAPRATVTTTSGTPVVNAAPPAPVETPPIDPNANPQTIFDAGMRLFKQSSFQAARDRFEQLLKNYPSDKLAESAQFWLGETLFADRKFEEAILAYNQLIKRYPNSKNLLAAQLKQGMSFAELGDTQAAKIIFNKIIADSPNSTEAKTAKEQLNKLPK